MSAHSSDPLLVITAGIMALAYIVFAAVLIRLLLIRKVAHPARVIASVTTLLAGLPALLYAFAAVVS